MTDTTRDCAHGQLARSCDRCADAAEIASQAAEIARLREALEQIARMPHAPDAWVVAGIALQTPEEAARAALEKQ